MEGKQVLNSDWIAKATSKQIENGKYDSSWGYGYAYQFWLNPVGGYRADGAFGQYSMVLPEEDAVVAITSESISTKDTMQVVWDTLVPAMKSTAPLSRDRANANRLKQQLGGMAYLPPKANASSPIEAKINGRDFMVEQNPFNAKAVSFRFEHGTCIFTLKEDGKPDIVIINGHGKWIRDGNKKPSPHSLFSLRRIDFDSIVAASFTWLDDNTLQLTWRFIETVHGDSITCVFDGDKVTLKLLFSVNRLQKKADDRADIVGKMA